MPINMDVYSISMHHGRPAVWACGSHEHMFIVPINHHELDECHTSFMKMLSTHCVNSEPTLDFIICKPYKKIRHWDFHWVQHKALCQNYFIRAWCTISKFVFQFGHQNQMCHVSFWYLSWQQIVLQQIPYIKTNSWCSLVQALLSHLFSSINQHKWTKILCVTLQKYRSFELFENMCSELH